METDVAAIVERLRPAVEADGGSIDLGRVDPEAGIVWIALDGSCSGCSSSTAALGAGIARIIRDHLGESVQVRNVLDSDEPTETVVEL